jgi:hypothetical protein
MNHVEGTKKFNYKMKFYFIKVSRLKNWIKNYCFNKLILVMLFLIINKLLM